MWPGRGTPTPSSELAGFGGKKRAFGCRGVCRAMWLPDPPCSVGTGAGGDTGRTQGFGEFRIKLEPGEIASISN